MCDCFSVMDAKLRENNSRLQASFYVSDGQMYMRPYIGTEKVDKRNRKSMGAIASFCPFCGERYGTKTSAVPDPDDAAADPRAEWGMQ